MIKESLEFSNLFSSEGLNFEDRKTRIERRLLKMFDESSFLKNKPSWEKDLFKTVNNFCLNEIRSGVIVIFLETYTRYSFNNLMFAKIKATSDSLKIYLKLRFSEIENPQKWLRDYEKISRQVWVEIAIREGDLIKETIILDNVFDLIKKAFNQIVKHPKLSRVSVGKPIKALPGFVTPTKIQFNIEIATDGFCQLGIRIHKSKLPEMIQKLLE